jgi:DNA-binding XRE family transcriptional regulator
MHGITDNTMKAPRDWELAIAHVLRDARVERGFKQRQLSKLLDGSTTVVDLIETGKRRCSLEAYLQLCELIGSSPKRSSTGW